MGMFTAALVMVLVLPGCSTMFTPNLAAPPNLNSPPPAIIVTPVPEQTQAEVLVGDVPAGFEQWYAQTVHWERCENGFECATISAPLSWHDAAAGSIELAITRHQASGQRIGALLTNPGGPGQPGIGFAQDAYAQFGASVRQAFDIVGFDPRGVGESTPIICMDDEGKDAFISADFPDTDEGREAMAQANAEWGQACYENTGEFLANVDTMSAARDMDLIRHLLGDSHLNYIGFSYGTQLGATYAGLFPQRVGRMVLDGAIDTTLTADELSLGQAIGFETALRNFVTECQTNHFDTAGTCPLTGSVDDGMRKIAQLLDRLQTHPLTTASGREVNRTLAFYGVALPLYDQASWPFLAMAIDEAENQNSGDILLMLADYYNDREDDGSFTSNSTEAFQAIGCVDDRATEDPAEMARLADEIIAAAPTVGNFFTYGGLVCRDWPVPVAPGSFDLHAAGAPPILVIGTTNDPATPYDWAVGLANTLDSGVLLTYDGEGHTAYIRSNACIADTVDELLVADIVPPNGKRC